MSTSYTAGIQALGATVRWATGFGTNYTDSILANYEYKIAKNTSIRTEVFLPSRYAFDIFNWHGHGNQKPPFQTYMVDLKYDF